MQSASTQNFRFIPSSIDEIKQLTAVRTGETKIGEKIQSVSSDLPCSFILLGVQESIGPQANNGLSGSENGFKAFLKYFLNMQSNRFLSGDTVKYIGSIEFIQKEQGSPTREKAKVLVEELDELVEKTLSKYISDGIIPIVIGGGHNNAYPIIKSLSNKFGTSINVVNLDPHADCRPLEGRHSGNPFSFAKANNYLDKYSVLALHKQFNSEFIYQYLDEQGFAYTFFEDYIDNPEQFKHDIKDFIIQTDTLKKLGVELDLDAIQFMPSSALTPSGISLENARFYVRTMARESNCCYLHLPEGAPLNAREEKLIGKALAYLVWDFVTERSKNN